MAKTIKETYDAVVGAKEQVKNKFNYRQFFMLFVVIFSVAADILIDYVNAGFDASIFHQATYWIMLGITCVSVVMVTLSVRDFFREKEIRENEQVQNTQRLINLADAQLKKHDLTTRFDDYVEAVNKERRRLAYKRYLQYKLTKTKRKKKREKLKKLLETADTDIEFLPTKKNWIKLAWNKRIRYAKVSIATIFSSIERTNNNDDDMDTGESAHIGNLVFKKLFMVISLSVAFSTLFFSPGTFSVAILVSTFSKLFRTAMSISLGASDGQTFVRGTLLSKMKLRLDFIQKFLESEKQKGNTDLTNSTQAAE